MIYQTCIRYLSIISSLSIVSIQIISIISVSIIFTELYQYQSFIPNHINVYHLYQSYSIPSSVSVFLSPRSVAGTSRLIRPSNALAPLKEASLPVYLLLPPDRCSHVGEGKRPWPVQIRHPKGVDLPGPLSPCPLPLNGGLFPLAGLPGAD